MCVLMWRTSKRPSTRISTFGIAWFWIALIPSSTIFPLAEVANDLRIFFPFMGLSLAAVSWIFQTLEHGAARRGRVQAAALASVLAVAVLAAHAVGTHQRNRVWRSEETLWADVVKKSPTNGRGKMNYGLTQMERGRYRRARELFLEAEKLTPNYAALEVNLAIVENALGNAAAADSHFTLALTLNPEHPRPHRFYAEWLIQQGRAGEAIPHLEYAIHLSPADIEARHLLMGVYAARASPRLVPLALQTLSFASTDTIAQHYAHGTLPMSPDTLSVATCVNLGWT